MSPNRLRAEAVVRLPDAGRYVEPICAHLEGHGARRRREGGVEEIAFPFARGRFEAQGDHLRITAEAEDADLLFELQQEIEEHVEEFAGRAAGPLVWTGDAAPRPERPPNFRLATVVGARLLSPGFRRVTLRCPRPLRFTSPNDLHVKLLIPPAGVAPEWPAFGSDGGFRWPTGPGRPEVRKYTVRDYDLGAGTLDVDFALHGDPGPGARWGAEAQVGDEVGIVGPGGRAAPAADWLLLAGDETALPAIARILESAHSGTRGVAVIELADAADRQEIAKPAGVELRWLTRGQDAPLAEAVRRVVPPPRGTSRFFWAAAEHAVFKALLGQARRDGWSKAERLIVSYWRRGVAGEEDGALGSLIRAIVG